MTRPRTLQVALLAAAAAAPLMFASAGLAQTAPGAQAPAGSVPTPVVDPAQTAETSADGGEAETDVAEVVVTGTSIRGVAPAGSPVIGLSQQQIQSTGATTTTEVLRQLPQVFNLGASDTQFTASNNANANVTAGSGINLRGLGTEATLTLVGGRRVPQAGTMAQYFDPSVIPTAAIGRIEVLSDGGSAIYGSDAIGGVVNILLRRNLDGAEAYARYGFADGLEQTIVGGVIGRRWSSGGVLLALEYNERSNLAASDRDFYTDDLRSFSGADLRSFNSNPGNIQVGAVRYAIPEGQNGMALTPGQLVANTANRQSIYEGSDALPAQERVSAALTFDQDINERVRVSAQAIYAERSADRAVNPFNANLTVPRSNAFFVHPTNPAAANVVVNYSFIDDFGPARRLGQSEFAWINGEVEVDLGAEWQATAFASYGVNTEDSVITQTNTAALNAALADNNRATAFNPFGDGSNTNPATLARIIAGFEIDSDLSLAEYGVSANGPVFSLPGGEVRAAVGVSAQDIELTSTVGGNAATPNNTVFSYSETVAQRDVTSAFAEVFIPVVGAPNARPGLQELSFSLAGRYDDYSDFGSTFNPKIGVVYRPIEDLRLRGSFGSSFRAPSISDVNARASLTISVQDFVDARSPTGQTRTLWVRGGNEELGPEEADIFSVGADWTPASISGLSLSATYFTIEYEGRIETPGNDLNALNREAQLGQFVVRNPNPALLLPFLNDPLYTGAERNPANILAFVDGRKYNVGTVTTSGLEFNGRYSWSNSYGDWRIGGSAAYLFEFERALTPATPTVDLVDTLNSPLRFQGRAEAGWSRDGLSATAYLNYFGGYVNNTLTPTQDVDDYTTLDVSLRYSLENGPEWARGLTLSLDVQNAFDEEPPVVLNGAFAFDPQVASALGRFVIVGVRQRF